MGFPPRLPLRGRLSPGGCRAARAEVDDGAEPFLRLAEEQGEFEGVRAGWEALGVGRRGWQACCGSGCVGGLRASRPARWFKGWSVRQGQGVVLKARDSPSFLTLPFEKV